MLNSFKPTYTSNDSWRIKTEIMTHSAQEVHIITIIHLSKNVAKNAQTLKEMYTKLQFRFSEMFSFNGLTLQILINGCFDDNLQQ